ncbi:MAG: LysR family transcriptional regulator [Candidatus Dactylopiibacterium carminicum]|uniref:LysR family transcriptional regulator n=1 Tax=Candidatus Dactylopiibacterium carminicum TaxID=857335 RepID=A0A272EVX0_9RHOO|nr:LysR family transcriptional regulator [Candidatus Dactylopiibacterium carminicum]KAF7599620.1 LysR family transcriptional regulator [Candidatus Dactylopiibacterium carminicum]PAS94267.1 MAG: LysR family transcriptional regulator [Candidatus Dactylopiibacterium carminicum]PAS98463.1 MAG: LysR family transcriptional regulator [Candidatus Dactylopiibacterium carminicum]PAS99623.1 MAG: hypothetical protein BSR46_07125 [Candidatus Dactylopiibacterium carminicum]
MKRPYHFKIDDIDAFVCTVRHESVSRAATALGLPQPAVTRRIQALEESFGLQLLDRNTRPPRLTPMGHRIYEQCVQVLRESEQLISVANAGLPAADVFRLGLPQMVAEAVAVDLLGALRARFPALSPQVLTGWSPGLLDMVEATDLDAAVVVAPPTQRFAEGLLAEACHRFRLVVVAARDFPLDEARGCRVGDLADWPWVLNPDGCGLRLSLQRLFEEAGFPIRVVSDSFGTALQLALVANGLGLGFMPRPLVEASPCRERLRVIEIAGFAPVAALWLVRGKASQRPAGWFATCRESVLAAWPRDGADAVSPSHG